MEYFDGLWYNKDKTEAYQVLETGLVEKFNMGEAMKLPCLICGEDACGHTALDVSKHFLKDAKEKILKRDKMTARTQADNTSWLLENGFEESSKSPGIFMIDEEADGRPIRVMVDFRETNKRPDTEKGNIYSIYQDVEDDDNGKWVQKGVQNKVPLVKLYADELKKPIAKDSTVEEAIKDSQGVPQKEKVVEKKVEPTPEPVAEVIETPQAPAEVQVFEHPPPCNETAIVPQQPMNIDMIMPVEQAIVAWGNYQELTKAILTKDDYQKIGEKAFKKKSAFRKYARFYGVSTEIVSKTFTRNDEGRIINAEFIVRAIMGGRHVDAWGSCGVEEQRFKGKVNMKSDHDIPATAETRATSRAISNIIGAGDVSAEEM